MRHRYYVNAWNAIFKHTTGSSIGKVLRREGSEWYPIWNPDRTSSGNGCVPGKGKVSDFLSVPFITMKTDCIENLEATLDQNIPS